MSLAVDNMDVLRHGWEDAVATVTPDLGDVRAAMEDQFARAVADNRLDEESLLSSVRDIVTVRPGAGAPTMRACSARPCTGPCTSTSSHSTR